jgi:hypothetical protein
MTTFKKIALGVQSVIDELKWPVIENSAKKRIKATQDAVEDVQDKRTFARIEAIRKLGATMDKGEQDRIIDAILELDRELFLVKQKADFAKALGEELFAKAD